jgi:hypothetical protein
MEVVFGYGKDRIKTGLIIVVYKEMGAAFLYKIIPRLRVFS